MDQKELQTTIDDLVYVRQRLLFYKNETKSKRIYLAAERDLVRLLWEHGLYLRQTTKIAVSITSLNPNHIENIMKVYRISILPINKKIKENP